MQRSFLVPATTPRPRTEQEAKEHKASADITKYFIGTLNAKGIYAKISKDDSITYLDSHRPEVEDLAKGFNLQLIVCYEP